MPSPGNPHVEPLRKAEAEHLAECRRHRVDRKRNVEAARQAMREAGG